VKKWFSRFLVFALLANLGVGLVALTASAGEPVFVTICHAAGLAADPANSVTLTLPENAVYGQAGHFNENGTPQAGHEEDTLGACPEVTPSPTPSVTPTPDPSPSPSETPSVTPSPSSTPSESPSPTETVVSTPSETTTPPMVPGPPTGHGPGKPSERTPGTPTREGPPELAFTGVNDTQKKGALMVGMSLMGLLLLGFGRALTRDLSDADDDLSRRNWLGSKRNHLS